jgi:hypothetical protein
MTIASIRIFINGIELDVKRPMYIYIYLLNNKMFLFFNDLVILLVDISLNILFFFFLLTQFIDENRHR